jgi:membrane fusion protein (multidrug efflux system)
MKKTSILICAVLSILLSSCGHDEHTTHESTKFIVTTPIIKDTLTYHDYVCQIQSIQHIELRAIEDGYIQDIFVDEGKFVKQGQLLFQIMPVIYRAKMEKELAHMKLVEIEYQNTKQLADSGIVSHNELSMAKAKVEKAKAELSLAQGHLAFTEIRAPFDGILDRFHVRQGSLVDDGDLLTNLSNNSTMWVYFNVPESEYLDYITQERQDSSLKVQLQMANKKLFDQTGTVETIQADFNNETGNIAFRAAFKNPNGILRHGETGNILMPVHHDKAMIIPQKATFEILDKKYVYVVDSTNTVQARHIKIETELPHLYIVKAGLLDNERILVDGLRKVKNGDHIECVNRPLETIIHEMHQLYAE